MFSAPFLGLKTSETGEDVLSINFNEIKILLSNMTPATFLFLDLHQKQNRAHHKRGSEPSNRQRTSAYGNSGG